MDENMHRFDLLVSGSLRIWCTPSRSRGACSSLCFFLWWSTNECNPVSFGLLIYTQECSPEPSEKAITFIVLRCSMTLMSPALHPAHQTLQEEGRFWGDSVAVEWGQLLPLPVSPILCGKQDVTQRCLMPFPQSDWEMGTLHILLHHSAAKLVWGFE